MRLEDRLQSLARRAGLAVYGLPSRNLKSYGRLLFPEVEHIPGVDGVALTFDDGPDHCLGEFLATLDRYGARATFFLVGEQVRAAPGRVAEIVAAGHEVGLHCDQHLSHLSLTPRQVLEDLRRARATIEDAAGRPIRLYRPPYGQYNLVSWIAVGRLGWTRVRWSRDPRDWAADATPDGIVAAVGKPRPGDIILLHDSDRYSARGSHERTLAALPRILDTISAAGLAARPVGVLLEEGRAAPRPSDVSGGGVPARMRADR